jgi:hypothetical protein
MNARCLLVVALVVCGGNTLHAQDKQPQAKPTGIDKASAEAWKKRDFEVGWMRHRGGRGWLTPEYPKDAGDAIPALWYRGSGRELTNDDLKDLPPVNVPFALNLAGRSKVTDDGLEHLAGLTNLTWLDLGSSQVGGEGLKYLANLKHLATLRLAHTRVTDAGTMQLGKFKNLTSLSLDNTQVTDEGLKDLAKLKSLTSLDLSTSPITDNGLKHLAELTNLTELHLNNTNISDEGLKDLAGLTNLTTLDVWNTEVTGENLKALAGLKKLTTFGVENKKVTDDLLRALNELGLLHALFQADVHGGNDAYVEDGRRPSKPEDVRTLFLSSTSVTDEGLKYLAVFPNLTNLHLGTHQATPEGLKQLRDHKNLAVLHLASTEKAGDGLKHLADLKKLTVIHIGGTDVTREDVKRLSDLKPLTYLSLPVTDETLQWLQESKSLHLLARARTADGKRPTTDDEIASLDLSRVQMEGEGLKYVAKLKNIATVNLRDTKVIDVWIEDFQRTVPKCKIVK